MTSAKVKGQKKELLCANELKKENWVVVFRSMTVKQGPMYFGHDFADIFDVVAIKREPKPIPEINNWYSYNALWKFVSCKTYGKSGKFLDHQKIIKQFKEDYGLHNMEFEFWLWHKPQWEGAGKNKKWNSGGFEKITIE
jgi:hypothetical protein